MKNLTYISLLVVLFFSMLDTNQAQTKSSVWAVDYIKAKPGQYENYLKYLQTNWVKARVEAQKQKFIVSYKLMVLPQNAKNEWDFMLMTEYPDKKMFDSREDNFKKVFKSIRGDKGPTLIDGKGARDLADILMSKEFSEAAGG